MKNIDKFLKKFKKAHPLTIDNYTFYYYISVIEDTGNDYINVVFTDRNLILTFSVHKDVYYKHTYFFEDDLMSSMFDDFENWYIEKKLEEVNILRRKIKIEKIFGRLENNI